MKIRPVAAELFHLNNRRDTTKLIVALRYFANAPNTCHRLKSRMYNFVRVSNMD